MKIQVINNSPFRLPEYKTSGSSGMDLQANIPNPLSIKPGETMLIPTGIRIALPQGYEIQIRPRSGLSLQGIVAQLGTIDSDYRGDIGIILHNSSRCSFTVTPGARLAQLVVSRSEHIEWQPVERLPSSDRGSGGFGHTGI